MVSKHLRSLFVLVILGMLALHGAAAPRNSGAQDEDPLKRQKSEKQKKEQEKKLKKELGQNYKKWLEEDVRWIILDDEMQAFKQFSNDEERENFIEQFWIRRDPTPDTLENEYREEHYRRIAYANERFAAGKAGWRTDRGRIYVMFGAPDQIDEVAATFDALGLGHAGNFKWKCDVVDHGAPGEGRLLLEDHADRRMRALHCLACDGDAALVGVEQPAHHVEQRGLAAARRTDHRQELARRDRERHVIDRGEHAVGRLEALDDVLDHQDRIGHRGALGQAVRRDGSQPPRSAFWPRAIAAAVAGL